MARSSRGGAIAFTTVDSGTEILRDTPIAHAEMNVFATLSTSLDLTQAHPLVEPATLPALRGRICFHACRTVRLSRRRPFFQGVERLPELNPFLAERWPRYDGPTNEIAGPSPRCAAIKCGGIANPGGSVVIENRKIELETTGLIEDIVARRLWKRRCE